MYMLVLKPICHETLWGGQKLKKRIETNCEKVGHLYSVYCRAGISNEILNGTNKGKTLNDVFPDWKSQFYMASSLYFPLTIALTEAGEHLSIQVHPNDEAANRLEHKARGKRESWYFLDPPTDGWIYCGCTCETQEALDVMLENRRYADMADKLRVKAGDYVFVQPGTLHSITAGSLVYEIEEGADFTYRFYDYDRYDADGNLRELHIEKAIASLEIGQRSVAKTYPPSGEIAEETYATKKLKKIDYYANQSDTIECFTLIEGSCICDGVPLLGGSTVLLWPGEEIRNAKIELAFAARQRGV